MSSSKTYIPFKTTQTADSDGLPRAAEVVVLFNSVVSMPPGGNLHSYADFYWFTYSIMAATNAAGNGVTAQYSNDKGVTWNEFYASTTGEPVGDSTTFTDEIFIGPHQDVRVLYTNGAVKQSAFLVNLSLDSKERTGAV